VWELFDVVCGTSTGGIIALGTCCARVPAKDMAYVYQHRAKEIFPQGSQEPDSGTPSLDRDALAKLSLYSTDGLEKILKEKTLCKEEGGEHLVPVHLEDGEANVTSWPKVFAVSAEIEAGGKVSPFLFRTYDPENERPGECFPAERGKHTGTVWEAGMATGAAPFYFDSREIDGKEFVDGGIIANNPTAMALAEIQAVWPDRRIGCVVSIGCGLPGEGVQKGAGGFDKVALHAVWEELFSRLDEFKELTQLKQAVVDLSDQVGIIDQLYWVADKSAIGDALGKIQACVNAFLSIATTAATAATTLRVVSEQNSVNWEGDPLVATQKLVHALLTHPSVSNKDATRDIRKLADDFFETLRAARDCATKKVMNHPILACMDALTSPELVHKTMLRQLGVDTMDQPEAQKLGGKMARPAPSMQSTIAGVGAVYVRLNPPLEFHAEMDTSDADDLQKLQDSSESYMKELSESGGHSAELLQTLKRLLLHPETTGD
jgi:hypothetical protein